MLRLLAYSCSALFLFIFYVSFFFTSYFFFSFSFGQGTAKTVKVGRIVAALGMSPLVSSFYLVIYTRVLCSSWEDICLAMRTDRMLAAAKV